MANKGIWIDLKEIDKLWTSAYKPISNEDITIVQTATGNGLTLKVLRLAYGKKGIAMFTADRLPYAIQNIKNWPEQWKEEDYMEILKEGLSVPTIWIPGPVKAAITKVSKKHGAIALHGKGGEIRIWEQAKGRTRGLFYGHEWGIEIRVGNVWLSKRSEPGKVFYLERLIHTYDRLAEMYRIVNWM